jgi:hypothetical protein
LLFVKKGRKNFNPFFFSFHFIFLPFFFFFFLAIMEQQLFVVCNNDDNKIEELKEILKNNPTLNVNWKNEHYDGCTALDRACVHGTVDVVRLLMAHRDIDINQKDNYGRFPFMTACRNGHSQIVRMFLNDPRLTTINERNNFGHTALSRAALWGRLEVIKWMIASGREIDIGEEGSETDAVRMARGVENETEVVSLLESFKEDQFRTRQEIRKELGLLNQLAAELFNLIVLQCDGYLQVREGEKEIDDDETDIEIKTKKFFGIATRLPMELQGLLCHRVFDSAKDNVTSKDFNKAFDEFLQKTLK